MCCLAEYNGSMSVSLEIYSDIKLQCCVMKELYSGRNTGDRDTQALGHIVSRATVGVGSLYTTQSTIFGDFQQKPQIMKFLS